MTHLHDQAPTMTAGSNESVVHMVAGGEISVWVDKSGAIHLKTHDPRGDPIELAEHEALELAQLLQELVEAQRR